MEKIFYFDQTHDKYLRYYEYDLGNTEKKPLLLYIHGAGSRGNSLAAMGIVGPLKEIYAGRDINALVVAPQCHADTWFELFETLLAFTEFCISDSRVDKDRVYLCGVSMGAYTAWQMAMSRPEWFAALIPVCGGGMYWNAHRLKNIPIWAFHGALDTVALPEESIHMVKAVNNAGGNAKITIYPHIAHEAWYAFEEDALWAWLFEQKK